MSANSETSRNLLFRRLIEHIQTPLFHNAYALTLSSLATSGIGLVYWMIAAHNYDVDVVGINSAVISAMMFIAGAAELNLMSAIIRFIPTARESARRFVIYSYLVAVFVAAIISSIFILKLPDWSPALQFLGSNSSLAFWFVVSTMLWCIFVLQDSVLTGLRQTTWVPVENTVFSLAKIGLMVAFAKSFPSLGLFASWSFALLITIVPTNIYIFRKLIPLHEKSKDQVNVVIKPGQVIRFVAVDYIGALFWLVCTALMPVIVTNLTGGESNAYYYLAWTIANALYLFSSSMGQSLVVEAAKDQIKLGSYSYRAFKNIARMVVVAAAALILVAPVLLRIYGKGYSTQGTTLLRLLALSAVPFTVNAIFVSVARVQVRMKAVVLALGSLCISILVLSFILLRLYGIVGVGMGWLVSQSIVAAIIYFTQLRPMWRKAISDDQIGSALEERRLRLNEFSPASLVKSTFISMAKAVKNNWSDRQSQNLVTTLLPDVVKEFPTEAFTAGQDHWQVQKIIHTVTDTTVAIVKSTYHDTPVILKVQRTDKSAASQKKNDDALLKLLNLEELGEWRSLLPTIIAEGYVDGHHFSVERMLPGISLLEILHDKGSSWSYVELAVNEINNLHKRTAQCHLVEQATLELWVDTPVNTLRRLANSGLISRRSDKAIDRLQRDLHSALSGKSIYSSWIHGDFCPENILVSSKSRWITGIIDWDLAEPNEIPLLDIVHLLLSVRMDVQQRELGTIVRELLSGGNWSSEERALLESTHQELPVDQIDPRALLILCWLRHINANLTKSTRFEHHRYWISENIDNVIQAL